jgi:hypothetical protein
MPKILVQKKGNKPTKAEIEEAASGTYDPAGAAAAEKTRAEAAEAEAVKITGNQSAAGIKTFSGEVIVPFPANATDAASREYVDATINGLSAHANVLRATTEALPASAYVAGVITGTALAALSINGAGAVVGKRYLVKNQVLPAQNGIYTVTAAGGVAEAFVLTRATDMNEGSEVASAFTFVEAGSLEGTGWFTPGTAVTLGTTPIVWSQLPGVGDYVAGEGVAITGNSIAVSSSVVTSSTSGLIVPGYLASGSGADFNGNLHGASVGEPVAANGETQASSALADFDGIANPNTGAVKVVQAPWTRSGLATLLNVRTGWHPTSDAGKGVDRVELVATSHQYASGTEMWWRLLFRIPPGWSLAEIGGKKGWFLIFQLYAEGAGSPPLALEFSETEQLKLHLRAGTEENPSELPINEGFLLGDTPLERGITHEVLIRYRYTTASTGLMQAWYTKGTGMVPTTPQAEYKGVTAVTLKGVVKSYYPAQNIYRQEAGSGTNPASVEWGEAVARATRLEAEQSRYGALSLAQNYQAQVAALAADFAQRAKQARVDASIVRAYSLYVDQVAGSDSNAGTSPTAAVQTIKKVLELVAAAYAAGTEYAIGALVNENGITYVSLVAANKANTPSTSPVSWAPVNPSIGLRRGSMWREEGVWKENANVSNLTVGAYGPMTLPKPLVKGSQECSGWALAAGTTYKATISAVSAEVVSGAKGMAYLNTYGLLKWKATQAECEATPGSYYLSSTTTLYVNLASGLEPNTTTRIVEITTREHSLRLGKGASSRLNGLVVQDIACIHTFGAGSLYVNPGEAAAGTATIRRVQAGPSAAAGILVTKCSGGVIEDCNTLLCWQGKPYPGESGTHVGIWLENNTGEVEVRYNRVYGNHVGIFAVGTGPRPNIHHNLVLRNRVNGIDTQAGSEKYPPSVFNNFVLHCPAVENEAGHGIDVQSASKGAIWRNNIVVSDYTGPKANVQLYAINSEKISEVPDMSIDYNLGWVYPGGTADYGRVNTTGYATLALWKANGEWGSLPATGNEAHGVEADPQITIPTAAEMEANPLGINENWAPSITSPAIDAGQILGYPGEVYYGAAPDLGAVEVA